MELSNQNRISRREWIRLTGMISMGLLINPLKIISQKAVLADQPRLNPAYRINTVSETEIELVTQTTNNRWIRHSFKDIEANVIRMIQQELTPTTMTDQLALKYQWTASDAGKKLNRVLNQLQQRQLIYFGDRMQVKINEVKNG